MLLQLHHRPITTVRGLLRAMQDAKLGWKLVVEKEVAGPKLPVVDVRLDDEQGEVVLVVREWEGV